MTGTKSLNKVLKNHLTTVHGLYKNKVIHEIFQYLSHILVISLKIMKMGTLDIFDTMGPSRPDSVCPFRWNY